MLATAVAALICLPAHAGERRARRVQLEQIRDCVARLETGEHAAQEAAAARLRRIGQRAVRVVAREGAALGEDAWSAFAQTFEDDDLWYLAAEFVAAAHEAPARHRSRLLDLAHRLDPRAGLERAPDEVARTVRRYLIDLRRSCTTGNDTHLAMLGHAAVPEILRILREPGIDGYNAHSALATLAVESDVPVLRGLLLGGETPAARALGALQELGSTAAERALIDAVALGHFDAHVARALVTVSDRERALRTVRTWAATRRDVSVDQRCAFAGLSAALDASAFATYAEELAQRGSRDGVEILVRIVSTSEATRCRAGGLALRHLRGEHLMCGRGYGLPDRLAAAQRLRRIAGSRARIEVPDPLLSSPTDSDNADDEPEDPLARAADAASAWWEASKDRLVFDESTRTWSVGK